MMSKLFDTNDEPVAADPARSAPARCAWCGDGGDPSVDATSQLEQFRQAVMKTTTRIGEVGLDASSSGCSVRRLNDNAAYFSASQQSMLVGLQCQRISLSSQERSTSSSGLSCANLISRHNIANASSRFNAQHLGNRINGVFPTLLVLRHWSPRCLQLRCSSLR
jgi:hypothetical protein